MENDSKHWSSKVRETTVSAQIQDGFLNIPYKGCADQGKFCLLGDVNHKRVVYWTGKLHNDDIVLEVQGYKVSGYTLRDIQELTETVSRNGEPIMIKTVRDGQLPHDLRTYLSSRFKKNSVDCDLQQVIRDNLYLRTVPCTTRKARPEEVNGVDYTFIAVDEFLILERSGNLLESGVYEGNHYGTPKPSADATGLVWRHSSGSEGGGSRGSRGSRGKRGSTFAVDKCNDAGSASGTIHHRRRNKSSTEAVGANRSSDSLSLSMALSSPKNLKTFSTDEVDSVNFIADLQCLPSNWEMAESPEGYTYFIDHNRGVTQWGDPRQKQFLNPNQDGVTLPIPLPYGWEKVEDPMYGAFYIDHVHKRTQYERPTTAELRLPSYTEAISSNRNGSSQSNRKAASAHDNEALSSIFTAEEHHLRGWPLTTTLVKSPRGFGFTIMGGGTRSKPEFLQVKNVVSGGPAAVDGLLSIGDVLVRVADKLVLGFTHEDIVALFQQIPVGHCCQIIVQRGYSLPYNPDESDTQVITKVAVNMPEFRTSVGVSRLVSDGSFGNSNMEQRAQLLVRSSSPASSHDSAERGGGGGIYFLPSEFRPEFIKTSITRSNMGFGFTLADSPHGQRIRQILDRSRCAALLEGDILVEINSRRVKEMPHAEVVQFLKDIPVGEDTQFLVQRGGVLTLAHQNHSYLPEFEQIDADKSVNSQETDNLGKSAAVAFINRNEPRRGSRPGTPTNMLESGLVNPPQPWSYISPTINPDLRNALTASSIDNIKDQAMARFRSRTPGPIDIQTRVEAPQRPRTPTGNMEAQWRLGGSGAHAYSSSNFNPAGTPDFIPASMLLQKSKINNTPSSPTRTALHNFSTGSLPRSKSATTGLSAVAGSPSAAAKGLSSAAAKSFTNSNGFYQEFNVRLQKSDTGFGFRIIGGAEEGTQVNIGHLMAGGVAAMDGRIRQSDEIIRINQVSVLGATHRRVVELMEQASIQGVVELGFRRHVLMQVSGSPASPATHPGNVIDVTVSRLESEGFGFVIISSVTRNGTCVGEFIGRIVDGSPAERCGELRVGDRIFAVNGIDITGLHHEDIVNIIKESGLAVTLSIAHSGQIGFVPSPNNTSSLTNAVLNRANPSSTQVVGVSADSNGGYVSAGELTRSPLPTGGRSSIHGIEFDVIINRGIRGFGFSIRGGQEYNQMPLVVLRLADGGAAALDGRLRVGDHILSINGRPTSGMTHSAAIEIIQSGGASIRLYCRRPFSATPHQKHQQLVGLTEKSPALISYTDPMTSSVNKRNSGSSVSSGSSSGLRSANFQHHHHQQQVLYSSDSSAGRIFSPKEQQQQQVQFNGRMSSSRAL